MAETVLTNAFLSVGGVDLSDHLRQVTLNYTADLQNKTAMGASTMARLAGLKDWSMQLEFNQDFAASSVDATVFAAVGVSTAVILRPDAGSVSSTNPNFTGNGIIGDYSPISGSVGDILVAPVSLEADGDLTRATT